MQYKIYNDKDDLIADYYVASRYTLKGIARLPCYKLLRIDVYADDNKTLIGQKIKYARSIAWNIPSRPQFFIRKYNPITLGGKQAPLPRTKQYEHA